MKSYDKPITIEFLDVESDTYSEYLKLHAYINKTKRSEYLSAGAERSPQTLTFEVRFCKPLKQIRMNIQLYRILYDGDYYNIVDYDDFEERHLKVRLVGGSY